MNKSKHIFVAATRQNDGKTFVSLGLFDALAKYFKRPGYMKPVGQQFRIIDNKKIDKDAVLFQKAYGLKVELLPSMSPIAVPPGFTKNYILNPQPERLKSKIREGYNTLASEHDFILIEGTGHAGVGSVFDCSNADVAKQLGANVILVSLGGIGRSIDEIMLNISLFKKQKVNVAGVILNKILPEKLGTIKPVVQQAFKRFDVPVLGYIPLNKDILKPTVQQVIESLKPTLLSKLNDTNLDIQQFLVGDMVAHDALDRVANHTMVIVPGNRDGLILTFLCEHLFYSKSRTLLSGFIFTDGITPHKKVLSLLEQTNLPLMLVDYDTYTTSKLLNDINFKLSHTEKQKINVAKRLVNEHVDIPKLKALL